MRESYAVRFNPEKGFIVVWPMHRLGYPGLGEAYPFTEIEMIHVELLRLRDFQ